MSFTHSRAWLGALLVLACLLLAHPANAQATINSYSVTPMNLPVSGGQVNVTTNVTGEIGPATVYVYVYAPDNSKTTYQLTQQTGTSNFDGTFSLPGNLTTSQEAYIVYIEVYDDEGLEDYRDTNVRVAAAATAFAITGMTIMPSSVVGGGTATGTVTFNEAAPFAGITVAFQSNNAAATLPASDTVPTGASSIMFTVSTSAVTSVQTATLTASVNNTSDTVNLAITPANASGPTITALSPTSVPAGRPAFTMTLTGTGFVSGSVVEFNGAALTTTYVSATEVKGNVPASDVATAGSASITVKNPGGLTSNAVTLTITGTTSAPTITSLSPASVPAGRPAFTMTLTGTNFVSGSVVEFNGAALTTTYVSSTEVKGQVPASDVATGGSASITVENPGGLTSNAVTLTITGAAATPTITALSPTSVPAGRPAFTTTLTGTNFVSGSVVEFNGMALTTTYVSSTEVKGNVPASDVATAGSASITVENPGGLTSNAMTLTIKP